MGRLAIIDDSVHTVDFLAFLLRSSDNEVATFTDPVEFIEQFTPGSFDLILLDLAMPNLHGVDLFKKIRKEDRSVSVIAVTGQDDVKQKKKALQAGFAKFYVKPIVDTDAFLSEIRRFLDGGNLGTTPELL